MNYFLKLTLLLLIISLNSCSKKDKQISVIKAMDQESEMIQAYKEGIEHLEDGDTFLAAKNF